MSSEVEGLGMTKGDYPLLQCRRAFGHSIPELAAAADYLPLARRSLTQ